MDRINEAGKKLGEYLREELGGRPTSANIKKLCAVATDLIPGDRFERVRGLLALGEKYHLIEDLSKGDVSLDITLQSAINTLVTRGMLAGDYANFAVSLYLLILDKATPDILKKLSGGTLQQVKTKTPPPKKNQIATATQSLSGAEVEQIKKFFNNSDLAECFIELFEFQSSIAKGIVFENRESIIGFGKAGQHLRAYVRCTKGEFYIKLKATNKSVRFAREDIETLKSSIEQNSKIFESNPRRFQLKSKEPQEKKEEAAKNNRSNPKSKTKSKNPKSIKELFESNGFTTKDLRDKGGLLWVLSKKKEAEPFVQKVKSLFGVTMTYTSGRGWWTRSKK